jgi:hypothetical protein
MKFGTDTRDKTTAGKNKGFRGLLLANGPNAQLMKNNIPK